MKKILILIISILFYSDVVSMRQSIYTGSSRLIGKEPTEQIIHLINYLQPPKTLKEIQSHALYFAYKQGILHHLGESNLPFHKQLENYWDQVKNYAHMQYHNHVMQWYTNHPLTNQKAFDTYNKNYGRYLGLHYIPPVLPIEQVTQNEKMQENEKKLLTAEKKLHDIEQQYKQQHPEEK